MSFKNDMVTSIARRTVLQYSGISLLAVAGCLGKAADVPDITVYNKRNEEVRLSLTIIRIADGVTLFSGEQYLLANSEAVTVQGPIQQSGDFRFEVNVDGLFEDTYDVSFSTNDGVELYIQEDGLEFRKVTGGWL